MSIYPMAFDEEFHYGLIQIYATSIVPFGIEHTGDMAQYGAATADASYLFHYLMSFPYRVLDAIGLPDMTIVIVLRLLNVGFVVAALFVFRRAFLSAGVSGSVTNISLLLVTLLPVFTLLAAHINYDNLLLLVIAWCLLLVVRITMQVKTGGPFPVVDSLQLFAGVLIGMSIKYAFLPLALGLFIWMLWLVVVGYRRHNQTISTQISSISAQWKKLTGKRRYGLIGLLILSCFFATHYATNAISYGSPIPSCERVFTEDECTAYGPWNRNRNMAERKDESFVPMSLPEYMATEWLPGMTQRLTFTVAGKTNDFETKLPLPALVSSLIALTIVGFLCLAAQIVRKKADWLAGLTLLLTTVYVGALAFQLYGDYVETAEPVAINGRYLIPLLPLMAVVLIRAIRELLSKVDSRIVAPISMIVLLFLIVSGAGVGTYIVLAEPHWFWPGFGQESHAALRSLFNLFVLPFRY